MIRRMPELSSLLDPDNQNFATQTMTSMVGKPMMRSLSDKLMDIYGNSSVATAGQLGIGGQSLQQRMRLPVFNRDAGSDRTIRLMSAQIEPRMLLNRDGSASMRPFIYNAQRAISDAFVNASEATHQFLYKLNKDNPNFSKEQLAFETRSIVGDPSRSGAGAIPQILRTHIPYSNVAVQGTGRLGRAFLEAPINTSLAMVTSLASLSALSLLTAFRSNNNLHHLMNETSDEQRASNVIVYNGENGGQDALMFALPQEMRPFHPIVHNIVLHGLNMAGAAVDAATRTDTLTFLKNLAFDHIDKSAVEAAKHGINDALGFFDLPPYLKLGLAAAGGSGRVDLARMWNDAATGNFGLNSIVNPPPANHPIPNQSPNDQTVRGADGKRWSAMWSTILGLGGSLVDHAFDLGRYHAQGNSWLDSVGIAGKDWLQGLKDYNPQGNTLLWEPNIRLALSPHIVDEAHRALVEMRKTEGAFTNQAASPGVLPGNLHLEVPTYGQEGKLPQPGPLRDMYILTSGVLNGLNRSVLPQINQMKQQMDAVDAQGMDPDQKRKWMNDRTRDITDKYRYVMDRVYDLNSQLSQVAGTPVDIGRGINWQGDMSQFTQ
jgi:hypothetical protein